MAFYSKNVDWINEQHKLRKIRDKVFVCQWRIPKECEFDQDDSLAFHILIINEDNQDVATGRITPKGEIGRIAVEPRFRGPEVYQVLFNALLNIARQHGMENILVQCELEGVSYYKKQGFRPVGSVFMEAGIPRQQLACSLNDFSLTRVELTH